MRTAVKMIAILTLCSACSPAWASSGASGGARISAYVPAVCDISADDFILSASGTISGSVQEFCNTSTGFQIYASHRPLEISEIAQVSYGTRITSLNASGLAAVAFRSGQRLENVPVVINAQNLAAPLAIAFTLTTV